MTNELRFDGRVALVTGADRGLGREYGLFLARRGARVVVNDVASSDAVVDEIRSAGGDAVGNSSSVADPAGAESMVAQALSTWGKLDVIVNNAGIGGTTFGRPDDSHRVMATHFYGTNNVLRAPMPHLDARGYGAS